VDYSKLVDWLSLAQELAEGSDQTATLLKLFRGLGKKCADELQQAKGERDHELEQIKIRLEQVKKKLGQTRAITSLLGIALVLVLVWSAVSPPGNLFPTSTPAPSLAPALPPPTPSCSEMSVAGLYLHPIPGNTRFILPGDEPVVEVATHLFSLAPYPNTLDCGYQWTAFYEGNTYDIFELPRIKSMGTPTVNGEEVNLIEKSRCYLQVEVTPFDKSAGDRGDPITFRFTVSECPFSDQSRLQID
jgi:hypothetical protein